MIAITVKEAQVVHLIAAGRVSKEIAGDLGIDEETVEDRVARAMRRLGAHTRSQLVAIYLRTRKSGCRKAAEPALSLWDSGRAA